MSGQGDGYPERKGRTVGRITIIPGAFVSKEAEDRALTSSGGIPVSELLSEMMMQEEALSSPAEYQRLVKQCLAKE